MIQTKYTNIQPLADFDWDQYENGSNGVNLVHNPKVKTKHGEPVYCHEPYAQELYDRMEAYFSGSQYEPTPKDEISGALYKVVDITQVSDHEVMLDTNGGMSAVVDMNKEHQFMNMFGCSNVDDFMLALKQPRNKKIILQHAKTAKVTTNRVSIWEGVRADIENELMKQLIEGEQHYGYSATILSTNNGGYTVDIQGVKCFLPGSLASSGPITDFEALIGKTIDVCVVNYSKQTNNFVVSHKKYLELTLPSRVKNELKAGQRIWVKVTGQSKNGLFCAIRDNNGEFPFSSLMHRSTMSQDMESSFDKNEFVKGDEMIAYIHRIEWMDDGKYRIVIGDREPVQIEENEEKEEA
jgi:small subunit ribosomal protein S1